MRDSNEASSMSFKCQLNWNWWTRRKRKNHQTGWNRGLNAFQSQSRLLRLLHLDREPCDLVTALWSRFQASLQFKAFFVIEFAANSNKSLFMNLFIDSQLHPTKATTSNLLGIRNPGKTPKRLEICSQARLSTTESAANRIKRLLIINFIHMQWCFRAWNRRWAF